MNSLNVSAAVSSGSSSQGGELVPEAWGRAGCRVSAVRLCLVSKSDISREKEQLPVQKHSDSFFIPSSFSSLCGFTRQSDAFTRNALICTSHAGQCLSNPPISHCPELHPAWHTLLPALGDAACFAMRGFMICYISTFSEGWVGASSFHCVLRFHTRTCGISGWSIDVLPVWMEERGLNLWLVERMRTS